MLSTKECHGFDRISSVTLTRTAVIYTVGFIMIKEEFVHDIFENTLRNNSPVKIFKCLFWVDIEGSFLSRP